MLVFEVTESATPVSDGERLAYVPGRGFHRSMVSVNGDVVVGEERLRGLLTRAHTRDYAHGLADCSAVPGTPNWSRTEGRRRRPVSLLHQVV